MLALALVAALGLARQDPRTNALQDGVGLQAGESIVTLSEFLRLMKRFAKEQPPQNATEELAMRATLSRDLATLRLEEQAGRDFGLEPGQIERINRSLLADERDRVGLSGYMEKLKAQGMDAQGDEQERKRQLLRQVWEYSTLGNPLLAKRATKDDTIRPGQLREIFAENKEALAPTTVQLRFLVVSSERMGSAEQARESCEDARRRTEAGEDLGLIVQDIGMEFRDTLGLTKFLPPAALIDPLVRSFAESAQVGDLSEVSAVRNPKTGQPDPTLGFQLVELNDRKVPPEAKFSTPEVQRTLRGYFTNQRKERILERGRNELRRGAFLWVNPELKTSAPHGAEPALTPGNP